MARPHKTFDWELVERLAMIQCTKEEIAQALGTSRPTLENRRNKKKFNELYEKGKQVGRMSLRRTQFKKAEDGNVGMLVWLGKQYLGQADKREVDEKSERTVIGETSGLSKSELEVLRKAARHELSERSRTASDN
ncbi:hypothetical protein LCGC14_2177110 [marine sediment metagenome]|uniref:Uncharacterized protein n=1 Tax=marine sediment metagenome TaxID=412755 RepID=A0A0F9DNA6_9ZZZZ